MNPVRMRLAMAAACFVPLASWAMQTYCNDSPALMQVEKDRKEWLAKLEAKEYKQVEDFFGGLQRAYEAGIKSDAEVGRWFKVFYNAKPSLTPLLQEWVQRYPDSYAARRALAGHYYDLAFARRGKKYASETSDTQFAAMQVELRHMADALDAADPLAKKPIGTAALRIALAQVVGDAPAVWKEFQRAERIDPLNATAKISFIEASAPRWGGDTEQLKAWMESMRDRKWPPELRGLVDFEYTFMFADEMLRLEQKAEAIKLFEKSLATCNAFMNPYTRLIRLYDDAKDFAHERSTAQRYTEVAPNDGWGWAKVGYAASRTGELDISFKAYERAAQLGNRTGTEGLAWHYSIGKAVKRDPARALDLYQQVADRGGDVKHQVDALRKELGK